MIIRLSSQRVSRLIGHPKDRMVDGSLKLPMSSFVGLLFLGLTAVMPMRASAFEAKRAGQESYLTRAIFADGRLWVLSDAGDLSYIAEGRDMRVEETLPEPVFDLCKRDGHPAVITGVREGGSAWTLRRRVNGTWSVAATIETEGNALRAVDCAAERVTLLTSRRLIDIGTDHQSAVVLSDKLNAGLISSTYGAADQFFVGINAGEWGGGLRRIDRRSGKVTMIERNATGELCGGPLNSSCDPVNGIAPEPWKPGCIAVAVGLIHLQPHGRVVEVCADQVERLYSKPHGGNASSGHGSGDEPFSSVPFFGITREGDTLWAVGIDGVYNVGPSGSAYSIPLPGFKDVGGIKVSFDLPQFILVLTNVNQRLSLSGSVPIPVPR